MKREFVLIFCCLMALIAFRSCSHETYDNDERNSNFSVSEARTYFENNATDLRYNEFVCSYAPTKADDNIVPLWNKAKYGTTPNSEVVMIPILEAGRLNAMLTTTLFGQKEYSVDNVKVESHLVIQRYDTSKRMRRFITTVIGISHDAKANPYLFTGDRTMFQGFMLISDETGKCEEVFYYTGGERFEMHIADYTTEEKMNNRHLQMSVGFSVMETMITTKVENVRAYEKGDKYYCYKCHSFANFKRGVCSKCGSSPLEIGGGEAYFFCKGCGKLVRSCICNPEELRPPTSEPDFFEERCHWCGSRHCSGECRRTRKGKGGGDKPQPPTPEQLRDLSTVTIAKPVGGTVMGAGIYKRGSTAIISASPASGYVFAGWSGGYYGLYNPASFTVYDDMTIYANFYEENSECGKLIKNINSNLSLLRKIQSKITFNGPEFGYVSTKSGTDEFKGKQGEINLPMLGGMLEMAHTHTVSIHPSPSDLASLFRRYQRGDITDIENFKYIIVTPEYIVVLKIGDPYKMSTLLNSGFIEKKGNKYVLSKDFNNKYNGFLETPVQGLQTVEGWFGSFVRFNNKYQLGLNIYLYKTDDNGRVPSKRIYNVLDIIDFVNGINVCN